MKRQKKNVSKKRIKWSVFICHVTADKMDFVTPLSKELQKYGVNVWLDDFILKVGDSIRQKIDEGLARSRYGVVIFSPSFFQRKWPQAELDGLFAREMDGKTKIILPVRYEITMSELQEKTHLLTGKFVLDGSEGVTVIARKLVEVIRPEALRLDTSRKDAHRANERLLSQLQESGNNPTINYRVTAGSGAAPKKFDLTSLDKFEVKDSIASLFHSGMRIDLLPQDREEYRKNPATVRFTLNTTGVKKFRKSMETGRALKLNAGEFGNFQTGLGLLPSFKEATQSLLIKPVTEKPAPVRVKVGSGEAAVIYEFLTHRTVQAGTLQAHGVIEGKEAPFLLHLRAKRRPALDLTFTIDSHCEGRSIRAVKKFVQTMRALRESGHVEIFHLESESMMLAGKLSMPPATDADLWFGRLVDDVAAIAAFFGVDVKWPTEITEADIDLIVQLKVMIEKKSYGKGARFSSVVNKTAENHNFFDSMQSGHSMCVTRGETLELLGTAIEGYTFAYSFDQLKVTEVERTKDEFNRAALGDNVEVKFEAVGDVWIKLWDIKENRPVETVKSNQKDPL